MGAMETITMLRVIRKTRTIQIILNTFFDSIIRYINMITKNGKN